MHLDTQDAIALTSLATAAFDIERKAPRFVTSNLRFRKLGEEVTNISEDAGIGCWIGSWSATDR